MLLWLCHEFKSGLVHNSFGTWGCAMHHCSRCICAGPLQGTSSIGPLQGTSSIGPLQGTSSIAAMAVNEAAHIKSKLWNETVLSNQCGCLILHGLQL